MPEARFELRWPDSSCEVCYSPSTVVREHLEAGATYALTEFLERARVAFVAASDRVRLRYGHACARALAQLAQIETRAAAFDGDSDARVTVLRYLDRPPGGPNP